MSAEELEKTLRQWPFFLGVLAVLLLASLALLVMIESFTRAWLVRPGQHVSTNCILSANAIATLKMNDLIRDSGAQELAEAIFQNSAE